MRVWLWKGFKSSRGMWSVPGCQFKVYTKTLDAFPEF